MMLGGDFFVEFIKEVFSKNDIVLLSEDHGVKENLLFVKELIPTLYESGVYVLGMEFGAAEDQNRLDELVMGNNFDRDLARDIMFHYNVIFPYKEYMDLYKAVFDFNQTLDSNERMFRILNLSYVYDWSKYSINKLDHGRSEIFHKGECDVYRANIIQKHILDKTEKILILTGTIHAFTKLNPITNKQDHLGSILYNLAPNKVYSIQLHEYLGKTNEIAVIEDALIDDLPLGVDLNNHYIGESFLSFSNCNEDKEIKQYRLRDIFDGYIIHTKLNKRTGCTVDYDFLGSHTFEDVLNNFPDPNWHPIPTTLKDYWILVESYVDLSKRQ